MCYKLSNSKGKRQSPTLCAHATCAWICQELKGLPLGGNLVKPRYMMGRVKFIKEHKCMLGRIYCMTDKHNCCMGRITCMQETCFMHGTSHIMKVDRIAWWDMQERQPQWYDGNNSLHNKKTQVYDGDIYLYEGNVIVWCGELILFLRDIPVPPHQF